MKKYKAIVKHRLVVTEPVEFESDGASVQEVSEDLVTLLDKELAQNPYSKDIAEVSIDYEIMDVSPSTGNTNGFSRFLTDTNDDDF